MEVNRTQFFLRNFFSLELKRRINSQGHVATFHALTAEEDPER